MKNKKTSQLLTIVLIIVILIQTLNAYSYATDEENFAFSDSTYRLKAYWDTKDIEMSLPSGHTIKEVVFESEDEEIAKVENSGEVTLTGTKVGRTVIKATIPNTNYETYCEVFTESPIKVSKEKVEDKVKLTVEKYGEDTRPWLGGPPTEVIDILVQPLDDLTAESKWITLEETTNCKGPYTYEVDKNCIVTARQRVIYFDEMQGGPTELMSYTDTIIVDDIKTSVWTGPRLEMYEINDRTIFGNFEQFVLRTHLIEIPEDAVVEWKSLSDNALVLGDGIVMGIEDGVATIQAKTTIGQATYEDTYTILISDDIKEVDKNSRTEFAFEKDTYKMKAYWDAEAVLMKLPTGYKMQDVVFESENEDIASVPNVSGNKQICYMTGKNVGKTRIKASIPHTNYETYCDVIIESPIRISKEKVEDKVKLTVESYGEISTWPDRKPDEIVEISIKPLNNTTAEDNWIKLGDKFKGTYTYEVEENCIVTARQRMVIYKSQTEKEDKELARNTITVDDFKEIDTPKPPTSEKYKIDTEKYYITKVSPKTAVEDFNKNINSTLDKEVVNKDKQKKQGNETVATGDIFVQGDKEYKIIVMGDLNGDGQVTITDLSAINIRILEKQELNDIQKNAADLNEDGNISITDLSIVNRYILEKITL